MRDRDVRNAIQAALVATNAFDGVHVWGLPENYGSGASASTLAIIEPLSSTLEDLWDGGSEMGEVVTSNVRLTLIARNEDPQLRDESAELLLNTASDALNGQNLATLTLPDKTRIKSWQFQKPEAPERKITADFTYQYIVETWSGFDTTP